MAPSYRLLSLRVCLLALTVLVNFPLSYLFCNRGMAGVVEGLTYRVPAACSLGVTQDPGRMGILDIFSLKQCP